MKLTKIQNSESNTEKPKKYILKIKVTVKKKNEGTLYKQ